MSSNFLDQLAAAPVVILGLGREGLSTYKFVRRRFPEKRISLVDEKPLKELSPAWQALVAEDSQLECFSDLPKLDSSAIVFKTPGLPLNHPWLTDLARTGATLTSNTAAFFALLPEGARTIGVTGTKGKSTTTALIDQVLRQAGFNCYLGGNIGVPPLDVLASWQENQPPHPFFILELSSHQLLDVQVSPQIAVIQNVTPEHLDYYPSFEDYWQAKANLTRYQTHQDWVIFNPAFATARQIAELSPGKKLAFSTQSESEPAVVAKIVENILFYRDEPIITTAELPLQGAHNLENVFPSIIIAKELGVDTATVREALMSFQPLAHRLELVAKKNGVTYVNDSLATTPEAASAAIASFPPGTVILLAGGYDRHLDFAQLAQTIIDGRVKRLILFPPTGQQIQAAVETLAAAKLPAMSTVETMEQAVHQASLAAQPDDVVLLSPASASFGTFKDYADRGEQFKTAVLALPSSN